MINSVKRVLVAFIVRFLPETSCFGFKRFLYNQLNHKISNNVRICSSARIIGKGKLVIGDNVWIGPDCFIASSCKVEIGENVDIAPQVFIGTGTHELDTGGTRMAGKGLSKSVKIGKGTWIGVRAVILPGVNIGEMCMIAAGAVVTKDIPSFTMVGGVPARKIENSRKD